MNCMQVLTNNMINVTKIFIEATGETYQGSRLLSSLSSIKLKMIATL